MGDRASEVREGLYPKTEKKRQLICPLMDGRTCYEKRCAFWGNGCCILAMALAKYTEDVYHP